MSKLMLAVLSIGMVGTKYFRPAAPSMLSPRTNGIKLDVTPAVSAAFSIKPGESPPKCARCPCSTTRATLNMERFRSGVTKASTTPEVIDLRICLPRHVTRAQKAS